MNEIAWFFAWWCKFAWIKVDQNVFWVGMVKNGCVQSGQRTLKLTGFQEWIDGMKWFFFQLFLGGGCQKWAWAFNLWDPNIWCILRMSLQIKLIFLNADCDVIMVDQLCTHYFWLFKCQSIAVVLVGFLAVAGNILQNRICPSFALSGCFLGMKLLDFSESFFSK